LIDRDLAYEGFACPQTGLDNRPLLETLVVDHGRQLVDEFLCRHRARLEQRQSGLTASLENWLDADVPYDAVCNFAFGDMHAALISGDPAEIDRSAAALAIRLHAYGLEGDWQFELDNPVRLFFDGWMLPPGDAVRVSATRQLVEIDTRATDGWRRTAFHRCPSGWQSDGTRSLPVLTYPGLRCNVVPIEYLPAASPSQKLTKGMYDEGSRDTDTTLLLRTYHSAAELISEFAGIYLPWVSHVVKDLIPLPVLNGVLNSSSDNFAPGVISITNQELRWTLAEQLVHEATHQYLYILKRMGPMDDGSDENLYFSPFRNMGRPIVYILFAYHAFANVLLFYRMARAKGLPEDEPGMNDQRKLEADLRMIETALQTTKALTPLGRALWEPLHDLLRQTN
jgi:HEXXH motif-containing protein